MSWSLLNRQMSRVGKLLAAAAGAITARREYSRSTGLWTSPFIRALILAMADEAGSDTTSKASPWLTVLLTALLTSLGAGAGGYFFSDSLAERERSQTRKEVLKQYFDVDNNVPGKRLQILKFVQATLAQDDPRLADWVVKEMEVVTIARNKLIADIEELRANQIEIQPEIDRDDSKEEAARRAAEAERIRRMEEAERIRRIDEMERRGIRG